MRTAVTKTWACADVMDEVASKAGECCHSGEVQQRRLKFLSVPRLKLKRVRHFWVVWLVSMNVKIAVLVPLGTQNQRNVCGRCNKGTSTASDELPQSVSPCSFFFLKNNTCDSCRKRSEGAEQTQSFHCHIDLKMSDTSFRL